MRKKKGGGKCDWESITMLIHKTENQNPLTQILQPMKSDVAQKYCHMLLFSKH